MECHELKMDTSDLLMNLEHFLQDQRLKLNDDKEKIEKVTSPLHPIIQSTAQTEQSKFPEFLFRYDRKYQSSACQTDISLPNSPATSVQTESMLDHPKYGLPGLGEFQDQHKIIQLEQKRQLNEILSEAIREKERERERLRKTRSAPVDYEDLLAQKREEEARYRYYNNLGPRYAYSGGYLDSKPLPPLRNNYMEDYRRIPPQQTGSSVVDELSSLLSRLQMYAEGDRLPLAAENLLKSDMIPEKDVPKPTVGVGIIPQGQDTRKSLQEGYRRDLEEQMREQRERKRRMQAEEREGFGSSNLLPIGHKPVERRTTETALRMNEYREKEFELREALLRAQEESAHTLDGVRKLPVTWHDGRWPLPENKDAERQKLNYQEELRVQIEEKKRREREEKQAQRLEEERLACKLEEDRKKIQEEFEAEQKRQQKKEAEARSAAEALAAEQGRKRTELEKKRKLESEKEWWERNKNEEQPKPNKPKLDAPRESPPVLRRVSPRVTPRPPSPILPALQRKPEIILPATVTPRQPTRVRTPRSPQETSRLTTNVVSTRTSVLGQLSAMRRRLQDEQERIGKRTQHDDDDDYEVFDARLEKPRRTSASTRRLKSFTVYDSIDLEDITERNQQRRARLKEWQQHDDYDSSLSER